MKRLWLLLVILLISACGNVSEEVNDELKQEDIESVVFRQIDIVTEEDQVKIEGEMKSWDGNFYYHVLQDEERVIDEEKYSTEHIDFWTSFDIEIEKDSITNSLEDVPHIVLYGKDNSGKEINPNYVPIDLDQK